MDDAERLTDEDLRFVAETIGEPAGRKGPQGRGWAGPSGIDAAPAYLRARPGLLDVMLEDDRLVDRLLGDEHALVRVSPRLVFSVLLRRVARDLHQTSYTVERTADETVAVFDATRVRRFIAEPAIWRYLVSMLTSFVRNESVTLFVRRGSHYVRRRFNTSSLDDMIDLSGLAGEDVAPAIFRRIGDIALFQSGIFPRSLGWNVRRPRERVIPPTLASYEEQGRRFYRLAASRSGGHGPQTIAVAGPPVSSVSSASEADTPAGSGDGRVLQALAEEFPAARKSLELLADRYLRWSTVKLFPGFDA
jgi:hypothetical protein